MRSCERPRKRSASEALPSSVSNRYSLSIRTHGSSCLRRASSSLRRVSSFSASSSSSRAASHYLRVPVMCFVIALLSFLRVSVASRGTGSSPQPLDLRGQDAGEVLPALLVAAAHLVVGEPVLRQHQVGGAAGRLRAGGGPGTGGGGWSGSFRQSASSISLSVRFEECRELVEAVAPKPLVAGGPARDAPDRLRIEGDMVLAACPRAPHQPGALEHLHVLRDSVERHVEGLGEIGYARGALRQLLDDLSARRVRERREGEVENRAHIFNLWVEYSN